MAESAQKTTAPVERPGTKPEIKEDGFRLSIKSGGPLWWGILVVYLFLFVSTGYLAFLAKDFNPALDVEYERLGAALSDETTKGFVMKVLQDEDTEHDEKAKLASNSFHIVLGALLGFLSASAVSKINRDEGAGEKRDG